MISKTRLFAPLVLLFAFPFLSIGVLLPSADADLIAHWTGDGTAVDATGNGHHGTLVNGTTYGSGALGQAFRFDGVDDFVSVAGDLALQPSSISVAFWVNAAPESHLRLVVDSSHGGSGLSNQGGWALQITGSNKIDFAYGNGATFPHVTSTTTVADNTFHHVVATLNGTEMKVYVDGILDATAGYSGTSAVSTENSGNIQMGDHYEFSRPLDGLLDEVRIYNHVLSDVEVEALAAVPEPATGTALAIAGCCLLIVGMQRRGRSKRASQAEMEVGA